MSTESMQMHQAVETRLKHSEALQRIQQDIDTAIEVQEVLDRILQRAVELVGARDGSLMVTDEKGELRFRARVGGLFPKDKKERSFKLGEGIAGWVALNCKSLICHDTQTDTKFIPIIAGSPIRSLVSVPIMSHGTVLGVINVDSPESNRFSNADAELLVTLANQTAVAIERAELLDALRQIGEKTLGGAEDLYQYIVGAVHRLTRCPVAMWRVDETGKHARIVAFRGISVEYAQKTRLDLDHSVTGRAIRERKIIPVLDVQADPDFQKKKEAKEEGWQSMLVVPLLAGPERAVGTLSVYSMTKREEFTRWELNLLRAFAGQAGGAIRNTTLIEELKVLNEIGQAVSVLDVEAIAKLVYQKASQLMDITNFFLCLYDKDEEELHFIIWMYDGEPLEPFSCELSGLTGWVVREREPLLIGDWDEEEQRFPVKADIITERQKSWLGVPLLVGEEMIGAISMQSPEPYAFNLDTQRLLETIASQAAIAIKNARLHADLERHIGRLQTLNQASGELGAALDTEAIFEIAVKAVVQTLDCTHCTIFALEDGLLVPQASHSKDKDIKITRCFALGEGLAGWAAQKGESLLAQDAKKDEHFSKGETRPEVNRSMVVVPLKIDDEGIGVISADQDRVNAFDEQDLQTIETLASQAGTALEKARAYKHSRQQLDAIREIVGAIGVETDPLPIILTEATELFGAEYSSFSLVDSEAGQLAFRAMWEKGQLLVGEWIPEDKKVRRWEEGIVGHVAQTGQAYRTGNVREDPYYLEWYKSTGSELAVPLKGTDGETIGVLNLESPMRNAFSQAEEDLCQDLANVAATAIEKDRLFDTMQRLNAQLESLHRVVQEQSLENVLDRTLEGINAILGEGTSSSINLCDEMSGVFDQRAYRAAGPLKDYLLRVPPRSTGKGGTGRYVVETRMPLYLDDVRSPPLGCPTIRDESIARGVRSFAALPLKRQEQIVGILFVNVQNSISFAEELRRNLQLFASQAAIAIENTRLFEELDDRATQLERLQKVTATISSAPSDLEEVLDQIVNSLSGIFWGAPCAIRLYDSKTDEFTHRVAAGALRDQVKYTPRPKGIGTSQHVVEKKRPLYVEDTLAKPADGQPTVREELIEQGVRAIAYLPLISKGDIIGVLYLNLTAPHRFSENEKRILELFADQAAIAIENAELFEQLEQTNKQLGRRVQELEVLTKIGRTVSNLGIDQILDLVYKQASKIMDLSDAQVQIAFYDEARDEVTFPLAVEQDNGEIIDVVRWSKREAEYRREEGEDEVVKQFRPRPRGTRFGLTEYVIHTAQPVLIVEDFEQQAEKRGIQVWPTFGRLDRPTHSWLGVPMIVQGRVVGIIGIQSLEVEHAFDQEEVELLITVASQAAVAIENARLYEERDRDVKQLQRIQRIAREISSELDLQEVLRAIARGTNEVVGTDFTTIFPYDPERGFSRGIRVGTFEDTPSIPSREGWAIQIVREQTPVVVPEANAEPHMKKDFLARSGVRSFVGQPILFADTPVGLLFANFTKPHIITPAEIEWTQYIANQAAVAIQNARSFARVHEVERAQVTDLVSSDFVHRLGNFLGSIVPRLQIIEEKLLETGERDLQEIAGELRSTVDATTTTQREMKQALAAPHDQQLQSIDLNILLRSAVIRVQANAPASITFLEQYDGDLPHIWCYPTVLFEVVRSTLQNAVDAVLATEDRGTVSISSEKAVHADGVAEIQITVTDTGEGIRDSDLPHLFRLHYTTKDGGMGYGLWRARNVLRQMGGDVFVDSTVGEGTAVSLVFPAEEEMVKNE